MSDQKDPPANVHAMRPPPVPRPLAQSLEEVAREVRRTSDLLERHFEEEREDRAAAALDREAMMTMLGDILARLPEATPNGEQYHHGRQDLRSEDEADGQDRSGATEP